MRILNSEPVTTWSARVVVNQGQVEAFEQAFGGLAGVISSYEYEGGPLWAVEGLFAHPPSRADLIQRIALAAQAAGVAEPALQVAAVPAKDWLSESVASFPPIAAGRFYIHGDHIAGPFPAGKIRLCVNAATAFGSGEHESTRGCLLALDALFRKGRGMVGNGAMLDMGCGTGILALAMAKARKVRHRPLLAVDIDPEAVRVTRRNAIANGVGTGVRAVLSEGPGHRAVRHGRPFGLITANILARPLMHMARDLAGALAPGGTLILAGLLETQEAMVLSAYRMQGLVLQRRLRLNRWSTLVLGRAGVLKP